MVKLNNPKDVTKEIIFCFIFEIILIFFYFAIIKQILFYFCVKIGQSTLNEK